jgi:hypothetical protein
MKDQIYRAIAILGVFVGFAGASVQAQTASRVEVNIPFEFSAGQESLKPGVYAIKRMTGNLVVLQNVADRSAAILNAPITLSSTDPEAVERLVFNKHEDRYSLAQIWLTADSGRQLLQENRNKRVEIVLNPAR